MPINTFNFPYIESASDGWATYTRYLGWACIQAKQVPAQMWAQWSKYVLLMEQTTLNKEFRYKNVLVDVSGDYWYWLNHGGI